MVDRNRVELEKVPRTWQGRVKEPRKRLVKATTETNTQCNMGRIVRGRANKSFQTTSTRKNGRKDSRWAELSLATGVHGGVAEM